MFPGQSLATSAASASRALLSRAQLADDPGDERGDVGCPFAKRRHVDDDGEPLHQRSKDRVIAGPIRRGGRDQGR